MRRCRSVLLNIEGLASKGLSGMHTRPFGRARSPLLRECHVALRDQLSRANGHEFGQDRDHMQRLMKSRTTSDLAISYIPVLANCSL